MAARRLSIKDGSILAAYPRPRPDGHPVCRGGLTASPSAGRGFRVICPTGLLGQLGELRPFRLALALMPARICVACACP
ncbi:hypothetical protein GCM10023322_06800 [Rugosimonospora acidiphila]|uniref:Uncharacterized protein n=1 Tax=Rugosimonospora acidiphila TaxID=556531 RepID=A0ABP9RK20_9ACTN